jgi:hypothetical protein
MEDIPDFVFYIGVGAFWGLTNPLLEKSSSGMGKQQTRPGLIGDLIYLFTNVAFLFVWAINQCGSALYMYTLSRGAPLSTALPASNALAFLFTAISSFLIGSLDFKKRSLSRIFSGCVLILVGFFLCS